MTPVKTVKLKNETYWTSDPVHCKERSIWPEAYQSGDFIARVQKHLLHWEQILEREVYQN